jgi:hypothetical protein
MKTNLLKTLLVVQSVALLVYTFFAFKNEGPNLFDIFLANVQNVNWNGQFNLDFFCYLVLSGLWIMWRNKFSSTSIFMGIMASILGIIAFAPYLLYLVYKEKGDVVKVLIGSRRV